MFDLSYNGSLAYALRQNDDVSLVSFLSDLGMFDGLDDDQWNPNITIDMDTMIRVVRFCGDNGYDVVLQGKDITVSGPKGFYVEF